MSVECDVCHRTIELGSWPWCPHAKPLIGLSVVDDSIPGGMTVENLGKAPVTFHSKSEHRRYCKEHGYVPHVRHVPGREGDKSPHTQRWI